MTKQANKPEHVTIKPSEMHGFMQALFDRKQVPCIWGPPGIGKSHIIQDLAKSTNRQLIDLRAVLLDPVDLRGLPHLNGDGKAHWAVPAFLPQDGNGILFIDELNRAPGMVQNALLQLVYDRQLGDYIFPKDWDIAIACNPEISGGTTKMNDALCNRVVHGYLEPDLQDWCKWAAANQVHPLTIAFLRFKPELMYQYDRNAKAYPTLRSWEFVSDITHSNPSPHLGLALYAGAVGYPAAVEYAAFERLYKQLPNIDAILLSPSTAAVPKEVSALYAISAALASRMEPSNIGRAVEYLERLPVEFNVMAMRDATLRSTAIQTTPEFTNWVINHSDVVL